MHFHYWNLLSSFSRVMCTRSWQSAYRCFLIWNTFQVPSFWSWCAAAVCRLSLESHGSEPILACSKYKSTWPLSEPHRYCLQCRAPKPIPPTPLFQHANSASLTILPTCSIIWGEINIQAASAILCKSLNVLSRNYNCTIKPIAWHLGLWLEVKQNYIREKI